MSRKPKIYFLNFIIKKIILGLLMMTLVPTVIFADMASANFKIPGGLFLSTGGSSTGQGIVHNSSVGSSLVERALIGLNFKVTGGTIYTLPDIEPPIFLMSLNPGWSLISLPVKPIDTRIASLFPDAEAVFQYDNQYMLLNPDDSMRVGIGYWIYISQANEYSIAGIPFYDYIHDNAHAGWSLIGACTYPAHPSVDKGVIKAVFKFTNTYVFVGSGTKFQEPLEPAYGYWINLSEEADIRVAPWISE